MSELKEKLKLLKKEREARSKSRLIKDAWEEIGKEETLSTREKLERLIHLTREEKPEKPRVPLFERLKREPLQLFENSYPLSLRYGRILLSSGLEVDGETLYYLSKEEAFKQLDLSTSLFLDLETTGLSGGTGVVAFLIGLGYYREDRFWIVQYFLGDLAEEERMIGELARFLGEMDFKSVVSFNGKGFDMPLLETRFILHHKPFPLAGIPHLDFLYPARCLWSHKHESCRLYHLAREVVHADRSEDISSAEVPWRYFQYLESGNFEYIEPVLYHNKEDIFSLLGAVVVGATIISRGRGGEIADSMDLFGAARLLEKMGNFEKSARFFQEAIDGKLSSDAALCAKRKLSYYFKKSQEWERAVSLWKEIASSEKVSMNHLYSLREIAMYLEHRLKEYEKAREVAEEGFLISRGLSVFYEKDFSHRLERLNHKIKKLKEKRT